MNPQEIFENQQGKMFNEYEDSSLASQAFEKYRDKTFLEANKGKYKTFNVVGYVFQALSMLCAATFMYIKVCSPLVPSFIPKDIKMVIASLLTLFLLVVIEAIKRIFIMPFVESVIKSKSIKSKHRIKYEYLLINIPLIALSVYTSAVGADLFVHERTDNTKEVKSNFEAQKDSVRQYYAKQIEDVNKNINKLNEDRSSRKWGLKESEMNLLLEQQNLLKSLKNERKEAIDELKEYKEVAITENTVEVTETAKYVLIASLFFEVAGIFCIAWCAYFFGKVYIEMHHIAHQGQNEDNLETTSFTQSEQKKSKSQQPTTSLAKTVEKTLATEEQTPNFVAKDVDTNSTTTNETTKRAAILTTKRATNPATNRTVSRTLNGTFNGTTNRTPP